LKWLVMMVKCKLLERYGDRIFFGQMQDAETRGLPSQHGFIYHKLEVVCRQERESGKPKV
jgi:hypothetical protein